MEIERQARGRVDMMRAGRDYATRMIVYLPPALYDEAERQGYDMRAYRKVEPISTSQIREIVIRK